MKSLRSLNRSNALLTITIRADLIGLLDQSEPFTSAQIVKQITANNQSFEMIAPLDES